MITNTVYFFPTFFPLFCYGSWLPILKGACDTQKRVCSRKKLVYCLLECSNDSHQVGNHTGIWWKVVLACFEGFACVPCCRNNNNVTSYKGPPKFNSFGRYFNQMYWDKLLNKLIITVEKKSLLSTLAILAQIITRHGKKFSEISF